PSRNAANGGEAPDELMAEAEARAPAAHGAPPFSRTHSPGYCTCTGGTGLHLCRSGAGCAVRGVPVVREGLRANRRETSAAVHRADEDLRPERRGTWCAAELGRTAPEPGQAGRHLSVGHRGHGFD